MRPPSRMRHAFCFVSLLALSACGGKVVFQTGEDPGGSDPGAGGSGVGGSEPAPECFLPCGEVCTKCVGKDCYTGQCSGDGLCLPPESPPVCDL